MLESQEILNLIFDDKAPDFDDFKNVLIVSDIDDKRLANLVKRAKLEKIRFANFDEIERAGEFAALFTNLEEGDTLICRFNSFASRSIEELTRQILTDRTFDLVIEQEDGDRAVNIKGANSTIIFLQNEYVTLPLGFSNLFQLKTVLGNGIFNESEMHYDDDDDDNDDERNVSFAKAYTYKPKEKKSIFEIQGLEKDGQYIYIETCYRMGEVQLADCLSNSDLDEEELVFSDYLDASYFDVIDTEYDMDDLDEEEQEQIIQAWQNSGVSGLEELGWSAESISIKILGGIEKTSDLSEKQEENSSDEFECDRLGQKSEHNFYIQFKIDFENGDTGERVSDIEMMLYSEFDRVGLYCEDLETEYSGEKLKQFIMMLLENPEMDSNPSDTKGICYEQAWSFLSQYAYSVLGWHDAQASIAEVNINGKIVDIPEEDKEYLLSQELRLQLVREDQFMYITG